MSDWFLYVVECSDRTYYTGITMDVDRRVEEHNTSSKGAKYTRARRPVKIRAFWEFNSRSLAGKAEYQFKLLKRKQKEARILEFENALPRKEHQ